MRHFHCVKPQFGCINPEILAKANLSLEQILEDEVAGMAFPIDARFFDNYPLVFGKEDDVAGRQYPYEPSDCQERMKELVSARYGDKFLEPNTFPHLFPWGFGGWHYNCPMKFESHIKMKLYDVQGWWAHDSACVRCAPTEQSDDSDNDINSDMEDNQLLPIVETPREAINTDSESE